MARRVLPEEVVQMNRLYNQYGTYAAVAKEMGRSASAVAKYVKLERMPKAAKHAFKEAVRK